MCETEGTGILQDTSSEGDSMLKNLDRDQVIGLFVHGTLMVICGVCCVLHIGFLILSAMFGVGIVAAICDYGSDE